MKILEAGGNVVSLPDLGRKDLNLALTYREFLAFNCVRREKDISCTWPTSNGCSCHHSAPPLMDLVWKSVSFGHIGTLSHFVRTFK
jgi:hypothetical protein